MSEISCPNCGSHLFTTSISGGSCITCGYREKLPAYEIEDAIAPRVRDPSSRLRQERGSLEGGIDELWPKRPE